MQKYFTIRNIVARWPGFVHDATIFNNSRLRTRFEVGKFGNGTPIGDSGYPLRSYLITPFGNPLIYAEQLFNESHIPTSNCIERAIIVHIKRFPAVCFGLQYRLNNALSAIATAVLHNIALTIHDVSPPPLGINAEDLQCLIDQGKVPATNFHQNVLYDFRNVIISNHFANCYL